MIDFLISPFFGLFRWKYVLTPLAIPMFQYEGGKLVQKHVLVFGIRVALWTVNCIK
jgi:hypothetical protein